MIKTITHTATTPGLKLLVLGAVHGNETCGPNGIARILAELESGTLQIQQGQVTFIPICNPRAYGAGVRFIERNLNRHLVPMAKPDCYEAQLGNIICPLIYNCDVLLDIHSSPGGNAPFVFVGPENQAEYAFAASLGTKWLMTGWEETYAAHGQTSNDTEGIGTEQAARMHGKLAALIECGDHNDKTAHEVAYHAIRKALDYLRLTKTETTATSKAQLIRMQQVWYRNDNGKVTRNWEDFDSVKAGETIATRADGTKIQAPADGYVLLPHPDAEIGQEWFYFGTAS